MEQSASLRHRLAVVMGGMACDDDTPCPKKYGNDVTSWCRPCRMRVAAEMLASSEQCQTAKLRKDLNDAADEMSSVAEALGMRRDAPYHKILKRVAELRAIERLNDRNRYRSTDAAEKK